MNQISAADNHAIQTTGSRWRLLRNEKPTAEATPNGLRYSDKFGTKRRLRSSGLLTQDDIQQVVLGWQQKDEAWHLGLIVSPDLANERGSRWVELVHWPDPDITLFQDLAQSTGQNLADVMSLPFQFIAPQPIEPTAPDRELPDPPLDLGLWSLDTIDKHRLNLTRSSRWVMHKYGRIAWYIFWSIVYLTLSLATLTADIALPNAGTLLPDPQWLPYLGIATFVLLWLLIFYQAWQIRRKPNRIVVDEMSGTIRAYRGDILRREISIADVQSVYVSELVKRREHLSSTEYGELNLHLGSGDFVHLIQQEEPHDSVTLPDMTDEFARDRNDILPLTRSNYHTNLQAAGLLIAERIGVDAWYDMRLK